MAWGLWAQTSEMTGHLGELDHRRMSRIGIIPLSSNEGLALLDEAMLADEALVLPMRLDVGALRAQARASELPALLSNLVRASSRRASQVTDSLALRLKSVPED